MPRNHIIKIRLNKDEYNCVYNESLVNGFNNMSGFVRHKVFNNSTLFLEKKIMEIHQMLKDV